MEEQNSNKGYPKYKQLEKIIVDPVSDSFIQAKISDPRVQLKIENIQVLIRDLLQIPMDFHILILEHSRLENANIFSLLNFSKDIKGGFMDTGSRSSVAIKEARKIFDVEVIGSSRESAYSYIPQCDWIPHNISFLHITSTNELQGNRIFKFPKISLPIICDRSADLFSDQISFHGLDLVYAHGDDEIVPQTLSIILIRDSILKTISSSTFANPILIQNIHKGIEIKFKDLFLLHHSLKTLHQNGGVAEKISRISRLSLPLYLEIERNTKFKAMVNVKDRSLQAIRFFAANAEDEFSFALLLDQKDLNILERSPHGDFLILLQKFREDEIFNLIGIMQEFEQDPKHQIYQG